MTTETNQDAEAISVISLPVGPIHPEALSFRENGDFWGLLQSLDISLLVSRERENFLLFLGGDAGRPWQSITPMPQPTGVWCDGDGGFLVGSTRTPNQVTHFKPFPIGSWMDQIVPDTASLPSDGTVFLPVLSRFLPGTLYIHDVVVFQNALHVVATDHNFLARVDLDGSWEPVWWPKSLETIPEHRFRINRMQLNSVAVNTTPCDSYYTAFSDEVDGRKPWRRGFGPMGRGVVISGATRETVLRGLTCPHSARLRNGTLWLCNSGYGELGVATVAGDDPGTARWEPVAKLPGFVRGLCFAGQVAFVGLSKVLAHYEGYAPGVPASESRCGISAVDCSTGRVLAELWWPAGHELYDIQTVPGIHRPHFPVPTADETQSLHHFIG